MKLQGKLLPSVLVVIVAVLVLAGCGSSGYGGSSKSTASTPAAGAAGGASTSAGSGGSTGASTATSTVAIENLAFSPQTLTVNVGTKVTWTNNDPTPHDVTSASDMSTSATPTTLFHSGQMNQGGKFSFTFTKAGTFFYECTIHATMPSMHAEVVVK